MFMYVSAFSQRFSRQQLLSVAGRSYGGGKIKVCSQLNYTLGSVTSTFHCSFLRRANYFNVKIGYCLEV